MKNKGFTLIELLAVIVIISVIALITTPIVFNIVSKVDNELSTEQEKIIIDAAKMWGVKNLSLIKINETNYPSPYYVEIEELVKGGFLSKKDLKSLGEENLNDKVICIEYISDKFEYSIEQLDHCTDPNEINNGNDDNPDIDDGQHDEE